jgi:hypothetical protein
VRRKNLSEAYQKKEVALKDTSDRWEKIAAGRNELSLAPQNKSATAPVVGSSPWLLSSSGKY